MYSAPTGMEEDQIAPLLAHRVFVTSNAKDLREAAAINEFSIIDTANAYQDPECIAKEISQFWMQLGLKGKRPFVLKLRREGGPILEEVE
ncbi:MAG: hypothetical protein JWQ49_6440 [Edaphobacter sp.]|nr:hypothetical protein [Edaphobacter sp.]